ncbi:hypothetical protein SAMN05216207_105110 [Pseudonocardia ammonioxydans]|uniref:Uncharacterized protein n=1 Tax=Pseudonocardia ammonioxydans TaxID=260086 RepID=A0A1I5GU74_PSUAM|nr:hypothetical protein [Pseudonocardia ammonioxydans]SFO39614.1 hypothetical protein SAMN05216207_105110 [Pseudonocardia ammonioxydans]
MSAVEVAVSVVDLPSVEATPLAALFDDHELVCVDDDPDGQRAGIYLGATYTSTRGGVGAVASEHLPALLREVAPGATWLAWEEPYEEFLGTVALHAPDLGTWTGECDSSGAVYVPADSLPRLDTVLADPATVAAVTGLAWRDRITTLHRTVAAGPPTSGFVSTTRPICAEWNRPAGLIYIDDPAEGTQLVHAPPGPARGGISEQMARSATAALRQAGWQVMPAAVAGAPWAPDGHTVHVAQVYRPTPHAPAA